MDSNADRLRSTTILLVRRDGRVALAGDGQVTLGDTVMKSGARKVRRLYNEKILAGFAGASADASWGARLLASAEARLVALGAAMRPIDRAAFARYRSAFEGRLGATRFAALWAEGRRMSPEEALTFLKTFVDRATGGNTELLPNTMYREGGAFAIESPLAAAQSVLDMVVQGSGGYQTALAIVLFAVAEIWERGVRLREEQELTV